MTQWHSWDRTQQSVPRAKLLTADSCWKNCAPCSSRRLSAQGLADIHSNTSTPTCYTLSVSPSINQIHHNCLPPLFPRQLTSKSPGRSGAGVVLVTASACSTLSQAAPLPASPLHVAFLYPRITPTPRPGGTCCRGQHHWHSHNPKPPHIAGTSGTELTSPLASPGERHQRGGLQRASWKPKQGLEERSGSKPLAKSCSLFYQEVKCLEHHLWAREQSSSSPQPPMPRLESPLLDENVIFRVRRAVKLVQSLPRTALPFQCQSSSTAATLPPKGRAGRQTPRPPPVSMAGHREPPTALAALCCETLADTRAVCALLASISQKVAKILIIKSSD